MKRIIVLSILTTILLACNSGPGKKVLRNGFEYEIHTVNPGTVPQPGQIVTMDLIISNEKGEVLDDSREQPTQPVFEIPENKSAATNRNPLLAALEQMRNGDSATVYVPIDSLPNGRMTFKDTELVSYTMKVHTIEDKKIFTNRTRIEKAKKIEENTAIAKKHFDDYMQGELDGEVINIPNTGLRVQMVTASDGPKPQIGDRVAVNYFGFLKDGFSFDNSTKAGRPFQFNIGKRAVIQGWDMGIPLIPEGGSAIIDIPYELAYGAQGSPPTIPPSADLIFFVTVEKINSPK